MVNKDGRDETARPARNQVGLRMDMPIPGSADNGEPGVPVARPKITYDHMMARMADTDKTDASSDALRSVTHSPWVCWIGGECPVKDYENPELLYRSGGTTEMPANRVRWSHTGAWDDVVAYRVRRPVMPEFCP